MREDPRDSIGRSATPYDQLVGESIAIQRSAEAHDGDAPSGTAYGRRDVIRRVNDLMQRRVGLLRRTGGLKTIDEAFPRVLVPSDEKRKGLDTEAILDAYASGAISATAVAAVVTEERSRPDELSDDEWDAFCRARSALATELGYRTGYDDTPDSGAPSSHWFVIRKDDLTFEMQHFAFPSAPAILGKSRIAFLRVTSQSSGSITEHLAFDRTWMTLCTDSVVQQEIDRVVAIFA